MTRTLLTRLPGYLFRLLLAAPVLVSMLPAALLAGMLYLVERGVQAPQHTSDTSAEDV